MISNTIRQDLSDLLFADSMAEPRFTTDSFEQIERHWHDACSQLINVHSKHKAQVHYLRVNSCDNPKQINLASTAPVERVLENSEFGILLSVRDQNNQYTVWLPSASGQFCFDEHQRIKVSYDAPLSYYQYMLFTRLHRNENITTSYTPLAYQWKVQPHLQLNLLQPVPAGETAVIPYVVLADPEGQFFEEISFLSEAEQRLYRKSNWFFAKTPADIWNYLINGSIYDPRASKGVDKRFKCQQCAYAWWNYFNFLYEQTGKKLYVLMRDEVACSVLLDMSAEGEWGHGFWSDDIETHARFHLDGLHLLISQYERTKEVVWLEAAERGINFVSKHLMEQLDEGGLWFLHDTVEHDKHHYFQSTLFGKTPGNSLCINTHVQALTVLYRLSVALPNKKIYADMFEKGVKTLRNVLDYQPGEPFYRLLMFWIVKYKTRKTDSIWNKLISRFEDRLIQMIYWPIRRQFPRLVHPGGFTARDLTFSFVSDWYHITNLKDFLTLYRQEPFTWLRPYIENGYEFVHEFLAKLDLANAVARNTHYIELIDILYLYNRLIEPVPAEEIQDVERKIHQQTGGYSLDYYASELVRD